MWKIGNIDEQWKQNGCRKAWWVYPDGRTENVCIPPTDEMGASIVRVFPVKSGYLILSNNHTSRTNAGDAGIYFFNRRTKPIRLVEGVIGDVAVSSKGCKVAFVYAKTYSEIKHGNRTLNAIDICSEGV
jgi:hypothetical protein